MASERSVLEPAATLDDQPAASSMPSSSRSGSDAPLNDEEEKPIPKTASPSWWNSPTSAFKLGKASPVKILKRKKRRPRHLYRGHRRDSFSTIDIDVLTELRARQRTFDGAYTRTALSMLSYALLILKIFSPEFAKLGLVYIAVALALLAISFLRRRRLDADFADEFRPPDRHRSLTPKPSSTFTATTATPSTPATTAEEASSAHSSHSSTPSSDPPPTAQLAVPHRPLFPEDHDKTALVPKRASSPLAALRRSLSRGGNAKPKPPPRIWGREFRTSGDAVVLMTVSVAALEVTLIVLLLRL